MSWHCGVMEQINKIALLVRFGQPTAAGIGSPTVWTVEPCTAFSESHKRDALGKIAKT